MIFGVELLIVAIKHPFIGASLDKKEYFEQILKVVRMKAPVNLKAYSHHQVFNKTISLYDLFLESNHMCSPDANELTDRRYCQQSKHSTHVSC